MIGYWCSTCNIDHAYLGDCPYDLNSRRSYSYDPPPVERATEMISIPKSIKVGESIKVYLDGREITLERTR